MTISDGDCEESPRVIYGTAMLIRICPECGRFVKADETARIYLEAPPVREANAVCSKHGRVMMPFEAFVDG